ncbi:hypothetical protein Hanom_Chr06g00567911 [Helianthus anomalus]
MDFLRHRASDWSNRFREMHTTYLKINSVKLQGMIKLQLKTHQKWSLKFSIYKQQSPPLTNNLKDASKFLKTEETTVRHT